MNRGIIDAILEVRRQKRLTRELGQVECPTGHHDDWWLGWERCPWCRAVV